MKSQKGFTLIELMIVVIIVGVLAMVALPAYDEQSKRGRRADGKAFIMDIASRQERFYTQYSSYTRVLPGATGCTAAACGLNYDNNQSPDGFYTAAITVPGNNDCAPGGADPCTQYTITITPTFDDPKCTTLTLTNTGAEDSTPAGNKDYCWR